MTQPGRIDNPLAQGPDEDALSIADIFGEIDLDHSGQVDFAEFEHWWRQHSGDASSTALFRSCFETVENRCGHSTEPGVNLAEFEEIAAAVAVGGWLERSPNPQTGEREWENQKTQQTAPHDPVAESREAAMAEFMAEVAAKQSELRELRKSRREDAGDEEEDDESNFVSMPTSDFDGKVGPWLSTPEGSPTNLSYAVYTWTIGYAVWFLLFGDNGSGLFNKLGCENKLEAEDAMNLNFTEVTEVDCELDAIANAFELSAHGCTVVFLFCCGVAPFHSLRLVTRRGDAGGQLELLGARDARISPAQVRSLQRWKRAIWFFGLTVAFIFFAFALMNFAISMAVGIFFTEATINTIITCMWWLTLKRGSALGAKRVSKLRRAISAMLAQRSPPDDLTWWVTVESPALKLASRTLPLMTSGWGNSLGMVAIGWLCNGLYWLSYVYFIFIPMGAGIPSGMLTFIETCAVLMCLIPVLMAYESADISSQCDTVREKLIAMRCKDAKAHERVAPLYSTLGLVNGVSSLSLSRASVSS